MPVQRTAIKADRLTQFCAVLQGELTHLRVLVDRSAEVSSDSQPTSTIAGKVVA